MLDPSFVLVKDLLLERFGPRGLRLVHQDAVNRRYFGNTYADFETPAFRLRLAQDRGQILLSLAALNQNDDDWYPVPYILEFLGKPPNVPPNHLIDPRDAVEALDGAWAEVTALLGSFPERRQQLDEYLRQRFEARMRGEFPAR